MEQKPKFNLSTFISQIQGLSKEDFETVQSYLKYEVERRTQPEYEEVEIVRIEDGCEGFYMDINDFEECARKDDYGDLIDLIAETLFVNQGDLHFYVQNVPKEELQYGMFIGKDNPYELNKNDDDEKTDN